jgi:hypothetical protein
LNDKFPPMSAFDFYGTKIQKKIDKRQVILYKNRNMNLKDKEEIYV